MDPHSEPPSILVDYVSILSGSIQLIRAELSREPFSRDRVRRLIDEFDRGSRQLIARNLPALASERANIPKSGTSEGTSGTDADPLMKTIEMQVRTIKNLRRVLDHPEKYGDTKIKAAIESRILPLEFLSGMLEGIYPVQMFSSQALLGQLISMHPGGIDENWVTAACYFGALEVAVNKKYQELGLGDPMKVEFKQSLRGLISAIRAREIMVTEHDANFPEAFWGLRNNVIHNGFCPNQEGIRLITNLVKKFLAILQSV